MASRHGPVTLSDQMNSVAHLAEGLGQNLGHAKRHAEGLRRSALRGDKGSTHFHAEHFTDHLKEADHHANRLMEHLARHPAVRREFAKLDRATGETMQIADGSDDGKGHGRMAAPKLGSGERFKALKSELSRRGGVDNPGALAAAIGRKKYGAGRMAKLSAAGRK
jgi:hypothetical protein